MLQAKKQSLLILLLYRERNFNWVSADVNCDIIMNQNDIVSLMIKAEDNEASTLSLMGWGLEVLPSEIGNLTGLTELDLGMNNLTVLPPEIGNLTNLTKLKVDRNHLKNLPPEIGNLRNLSELHAGDNDIAQLPREIGNMVNLAS